MPKWTIFEISFLWKHQCLCFHYWDYLTKILCNIWWSIIDVVENRGKLYYPLDHGLRTPREEIAFTTRPKIHSHSQIFRYGQSIFCLTHRLNFSDIFDSCLHWVSVVHALDSQNTKKLKCWFFINNNRILVKLFQKKPE